MGGYSLCSPGHEHLFLGTVLLRRKKLLWVTKPNRHRHIPEPSDPPCLRRPYVSRNNSHPSTQHSSRRMKPTPSTCLACVVLSFTPANSFLSGPAASASARLPWATSGVSSSSHSHPVRHAPAGAAGSQARWRALRMVAAPEIPATKSPGTADMDWENLGFEYRDGEHMINA